MIIKGINRVRQYWQKCMHSVHNKISRGAEQIHRLMPHARGENWRGSSNRHDNKK
jgi:hypothetical protein